MTKEESILWLLVGSVLLFIFGVSIGDASGYKRGYEKGFDKALPLTYATMYKK